ncbi:MAG: hypothetical protein UY21_C0014G0030 [Microgenomates group bacterium GW2011_GWA1_48_10]|nr:MAG: hypothetical protein UY21_C0014G0030 [Microgenomates group bacterium GW2011_GWA1_48_10]
MPENKEGKQSKPKKGQFIKGPIDIGGVHIEGGITVGGRIIHGDKVIKNGQEVTGPEADEISRRARETAQAAIEAAEQLKSRATSAIPETPASNADYEAAPESITSDDFVAGIMMIGGVPYKLDRSTIDQDRGYRYIKVKR